MELRDFPKLESPFVREEIRHGAIRENQKRYKLALAEWDGINGPHV